MYKHQLYLHVYDMAPGQVGEMDGWMLILLLTKLIRHIIEVLMVEERTRVVGGSCMTVWVRITSEWGGMAVLDCYC